MTGPDFTTALTTLGLDNHQAAQWLGVSVKSVRRYRVSGAPGPVAGMVRQALERHNEKPGDMLARLGMDGAKWAEDFRLTALKLGYSDMDEGWLIGWFCNAIMSGYDTARNRYDPEVQAIRDSLALDWRE